jgi:hypothetical protein
LKLIRFFRTGVFRLTAGTDAGADFTGTAENDTFNADILTLTDGDNLNGAEGNDVLNATINANVSDKVAISNVETLNFTALGAQSVDATNITGADAIWSKDSTGQLTINKLADATVAFGLSGSGTNNIDVNYTAGTLSGASDNFALNLDNVTGATATTDAGFESASINVTGTNSLTTLTVPGVNTVSVTGAGDLSLGNDLTLKTLSASEMTGNLTGGTIPATGYAPNGIVGVSTGSTVLLGSGNDNLAFTANATSNTNTVKLGAGNDTLDFTKNTTNASFVFGEAGDDTIRVNGAQGITANDLIDAGAGNDTVVVNQSSSNALLLRGVENLTLTSSATGANTINSADSALAVTAQVGTGGNTATDVNITGLTAGSTVAVNDAANQTSGVEDLTVGFKNVEASTTIDVNAAATGATAGLVINNVTNATVDFAKAANYSTGETNLDAAVTGLTVNAAKSLDTGDIVASGADKLKNLTVAGQDAVTVGAITNSDALETVSVTGAKTTSVGAIVAAAALTSYSATATTGELTLGAIGGTTPSTALTSFTATATDGSIATGLAPLKAASTSGITVDLTAKGAIDENGSTTGGGAAVFQNTGGNITASVAGAAAAKVDFTTVASGVVNLSATNTGGLDTTITNIGSAGSTSSIALGNAAAATGGVAAKENAVTLAGTSETLNITGGTGIDKVDFGTGFAAKNGTISLGGGVDTVDFSNAAVVAAANFGADAAGDNAGVVVNLSNNAVTFDAGTSLESSIAGGKVAAYNTNAAKVDVDASNFDFTMSGVENVVGTAKADYIIASNTGNTITGGKGADTIVLDAGQDTIVNTALTDSLLAGFDKVSNFAIGTDTIDGPNALANTAVAQLGAVNSLSATDIAAVLNTTDFKADEAATFTFNDSGTTRTFVAINDNAAGFVATDDSIIEITGYTGTLADLAIA